MGDNVYKFWDNFFNSDILEQEKMLEPILKKINSLHKIEDEYIRHHTLKLLLLSYFNDIEEYYYTKNCHDSINK